MRTKKHHNKSGNASVYKNGVYPSNDLEKIKEKRSYKIPGPFQDPGYFLFLFALFWICASFNPLLADEIVLMSGKKIQNVRLFFAGKNVFVVDRTGEIKRISMDEVDSTEIKEVPDWNQPTQEIQSKISQYESRLREVEEKEERRTSALRRSALVPGWGQVFSEKPLRGYSVMAGSAILMGNYLLARNTHASLQSEFDDRMIPALLATTGVPGFGVSYLRFVDLQGRMEQKEKIGNRALGLLGILWVFGLYDTYSLYNKNEPVFLSGPSDVYYRLSFGADSSPAPGGGFATKEERFYFSTGVRF